MEIKDTVMVTECLELRKIDIHKKRFKGKVEEEMVKRGL